ncbi:alkaline phosphatase-like [Elysia marginata]|uniref:Alkaline phosphatase n=1 Tax=Elysia marginata TaxID=1093978 RepID=A0AAV4HTS4_9GAST|nr:alkaline phosphatase-like [Elysia marginata]
MGGSGEDNLLMFETFPHVALTKTYSMDSQVTDSAAAGTSMLTGVKVNSGVLGCDSRVTKGNCTNYRSDTKLKTILHRFIDEGMSTGIVTNSRLTHATPASAYAQSPHREWEGDVDMPFSSGFSSGDGEIEGEEEGEEEERMESRDHPCKDVDDIAKQLVMNNKNIKVLLGGGRRYFLDNTTVDPETGREWKRDKRSRNVRGRYVWNRKQFQAVDPGDTDYLLGLFDSSHMAFEIDDENRTQPNLVEMTKKAIEILQKDKKGYFLLVEGARIDFGHHANSAATAISETLELDQAVAAAVRMTNAGRRRQDTLILVTADHSHAFSIQGYAPRGNDILGEDKRDKWWRK